MTTIRSIAAAMIRSPAITETAMVETMNGFDLTQLSTTTMKILHCTRENMCNKAKNVKKWFLDSTQVSRVIIQRLRETFLKCHNTSRYGR